MTSIRLLIHFTSQREYVNVLVRGGKHQGKGKLD